MNVSTLIFLGLAVVWAIVLLPEVLRKISGSRHSDTIRSFNHQLSVLNRSEQRGAGRSNVIDLGARAAARGTIDLRDGASAPRPVPMAVRKRRQEVLTVLGSATLLSLVCTVAFGGPFLLLLVLSGGLLVTYVVLLAQVTQNAPARSRTAPLLAPPSPLHDGLRTATVGRATPSSARRIAN